MPISFEYSARPISLLRMGRERTCFAITTGLLLSVIVAGYAKTAVADMITLMPTMDTFAWANQPSSTFGSAGALSVSGNSAVNGNGDAQGIFDTWLKFDTTAAIGQFNATYGSGNWTLASAVLSLHEVASPNNTIFNRGIGQFRVTWVEDDNWSEGPGGPGSPGAATGNQIGYNYGLSILDADLDESLGVFQNAGNNTRQNFGLALPNGFTSDVLAATTATLYVSAVEPQIGFTFNSRSTPNPPQFILQAVPEPGSLTLLVLGLFGTFARRTLARCQGF